MGKTLLFQMNNYFALYTVFSLLMLGDFSREQLQSPRSPEVL